jgi:hypothetical protein|tara:strand:+ start:147 stop:545 length:399 start_codon:yes stop_codon:yes gene_type:complete
MAAGINILVNDGGAPARIMKLGNAGANINAGTFVGLHTDGTVSASTLDATPVNSRALGVLLVDAVSGEPASVITGSGITCYVASTGSIAVGATLSHDGDGLAVDNAVTDEVLAIALEIGESTYAGFTKVLLL